jgi:N-acetylglutamate synthase-like GNAT family acetyltransferase
LKQQLNLLVELLVDGDYTRGALTDEDVKRILSQTNFLLLTHEEDGRVVGVCTLYLIETLKGYYGIIPELVVLEKFANKNILKELMTRAIEKAKMAGVIAIQVFVNASEKQAREMFKKGGFINGVTAVMTMKVKYERP